MNILYSPNIAIQSPETSIDVAQKATVILLSDIARRIERGEIDVPGAITFKVRRVHFDLQVCAELTAFDPSKQLLA